MSLERRELGNAVFSVHLEVPVADDNAQEIFEAISAAGFRVHSVSRLDVYGFDNPDERCPPKGRSRRRVRHEVLSGDVESDPMRGVTDPWG